MQESRVPILSQFEITPPQPGPGFTRRLEAQMTRLSQAGFPDGSVIEITCRPPKDTTAYDPREKTATLVEVTKAVSGLGFIPYPHLSARMLDIDSVNKSIEGFASIGINRVFLIAGDSKTPYSTKLPDSLTLATRVLEINPDINELGFAAYPNLRHPFIPPAKLESALKAKALLKEKHPDMTIAFQTQFTFSAGEINTLAEKISELGDFPLRVGLLGPTTFTGLIKTTEYAGYSPWDAVIQKPDLAAAAALSLLQRYNPAKKLWKIPQKFDYRPDGLVANLNTLNRRAANITGVYIYTMNNFGESANLYKALTD